MFSTIFTSMKNLKDTFMNKVVNTSHTNNDDDDIDSDFKPLYSQEVSNNRLDFSSHDDSLISDNNVINFILPSESGKKNDDNIVDSDTDIPPLEFFEPTVDVYDDTMILRTGGETPAAELEIEAELETETATAGEPEETKEEKLENCLMEFQDNTPSTVDKLQSTIVEPTVENNINHVEIVSDVLDEIFHTVDLESQSKTQLLEEQTVDNIGEIEPSRDMLDDFFSSIRTDFKSHSREHIVENMSKVEMETESKSKFTNYSTIMRRKLRPNVKVSDNECVCDICSFKIEDSVQTLLPCDHGFHHRCLNTWLKYNQYCSICKVELTNDIPTKEYIQEKYSHEYLLGTMIELGILETEVDNDDKDNLIERFIEYFKNLSEKKSISRKSSTDSLEVLAVE